MRDSRLRSVMVELSLTDRAERERALHARPAARTFEADDLQLFATDWAPRHDRIDQCIEDGTGPKEKSSPPHGYVAEVSKP